MRMWIGKINEEVVSEQTHKWTEVKDKLTELSFVNEGQVISLPKNLNYVQGKTASTIMGSEECTIEGECTIESRYIGYIIGNIKTLIRINELNNNTTIEITND